MAQTRNARKYILIPEFKPLFAMAKCFGPTRGPLEKPCPTPITIIGDLLRQDGRDKITVHEVIKEGKGWSAPVELTLDNYTLPYEEIAAGKKHTPESRQERVTPKPYSTSPKIVKKIDDGYMPVHALTPERPKMPEVSFDTIKEDTTEKAPQEETAEAPVQKPEIEVPIVSPSNSDKTDEVPELKTAYPGDMADETPGPNDASSEDTSTDKEETPAEQNEAAPVEEQTEQVDRSKLSRAERKALRKAEREAAAKAAAEAPVETENQ